MSMWLRATFALLAIIAANRAIAFPAFARKYGMSCTACHVAWPIFNQVGQNFRDNGYQLNLNKDVPEAQAPAYIPISVRTTVAYQFTRTTHQQADIPGATPNPDGTIPSQSIATKSGGIVPPSVDILTGGTLAKDLSFLLVVSGFNQTDGLATVESAWARLDNIGGSSWLNFKVGKFELDQPASAHRNVTLFTNYLVYSAHPVGSAVTFDLAENQLGVELDGHSARSTTRYALSLVSANGGDLGSSNVSGNAWSSPLLWGHVQQVFELRNPILPWVRVGALGAVGWWATDFATLTTTPGAPAIIPGTGRAHKRYYRAGAELSWMLGYPSTPLFFTVSYIYGTEDAGLATGTDPLTGADISTSSNHFHGGFAEVDWVPFSILSYNNATPFVVFARYDLIRYGFGPGDIDAGTFGVRQYIALGPRAAVAAHLELHAEKSRHTAFDLTDTEMQYAALGIDFDF